MRRNIDYRSSSYNALWAKKHLLDAESALAQTPPDHIQAANHRKEALKRQPRRLICGVEPNLISDDT